MRFPGDFVKLRRAACLPQFPLYALSGLACPAVAQEITGTPGSPSATSTIDGQSLPAAPPAFGGDHQPRRQGLDALVAAHRGAAEGRAERAADHDRRRRLRRLRHLRRRHPDADARRSRRGRAALHAVPLHRALLAHPRRADHRAQPPFGGLRGDRRASHRLSGLRFDHRPGQRHDRHDPQGPRLRHLVVRQEPQHPHLRLFDRRARSTSGPPAWASTISTASWAANPTSGRLGCSATTPRSSRGMTSPTTT